MKKQKISGTYYDCTFSDLSNKKIDNILKELGLKKDFKDDYHCTLIYSKKYIPHFKTSKNDKQVHGEVKSKVNYLVKIKDFGFFNTEDGKNLHIVLDCDVCKKQFDKAIKEGASYDYPEYVAHSTLMYNCKDFILPEKIAAKYIGTRLEVQEERISVLNENWLDKGK